MTTAKRKKQPRTAKANPNKAKPPAVVYLPGEFAATAANNLRSLGGTIVDVDDTVVSYSAWSSDDLYEAAINPAAALRDYHEDIPVLSDVELTAMALRKENDEIEAATEEPASQTDQPTLTALLSTPTHSPEADFANGMYDLVVGFGLTLLATGNNIKAFLKGLWLRLIAFGNDFTDTTKKLGNQAWAAHDRFKKAYNEKPFGIHVWFNRAVDKLRRYSIDKEAEREARYNAALLEPLHELCDSLTKEMRRMSKRITDLENQLRRSAKSQNNAVTSLGRQISRANGLDPAVVKQFAVAISQGRKANAVSLYRAMTGADLAEAKAAIEAAVAA